LKFDGSFEENQSLLNESLQNRRCFVEYIGRLRPTTEHPHKLPDQSVKELAEHLLS